MPRKTTILIVILALLTGVLIFLAVRSERSIKLTSETAPTMPAQTEPYAILSFSEEFIDASASGQRSVDIILDTAGKSVSGAQAEISYDPNIFLNVTIEPSQNSIFGSNSSVLFNSVDATQGRISYAVGIPINGEEIVGTGPIATITFTLNSPLASPAQMIFLPKSTVQNLDTLESVLLNTQPLIVAPLENQIPPAN